MSERKVDVRLLIDIEGDFEVASCTVIEGMSTITRATLELVSHGELELDAAIGEDAAVQILFDGEPQRRFALRLGAASFLGARTDGAEGESPQDLFLYRVELYPALWWLRFTEDTRKFMKMSAEEIVSAVLAHAGVPFSLRTTRATPRRNYCVQYHETNLDFVLRLLQFEGIYFTFDDDGTMVLGDRSSASPEVEGRSSFELLEGRGALAHGERGVFELWRSARVAPGSFTAGDFDWKKPGVELRRSASAERDAELSVYDYPTGFRHAADGDHLARIRLEALRVEADLIEGKSDVAAFAPAHLFTLGEAAGEVFAGEYVLIHVEHRIVVAAYQDGAREVGYTNEFRAIERATPFRPALETPRPTIAGFHTTLVRGPAGEQIHTDRYGRFRAQFHWDREAKGTDQDSRWMRLVQESASSLVLARVGWEVSVGYVDGDPDRPIGLARQINGVMVPSYGLPNDKSRMTIKTPTYPRDGGYNEWRMEDRAGAMSIDVRAELDLLNTVKHDRTEQVGRNEVCSCDATVARTIGRDQAIQVGADASAVSHANQSLEVGNNRTMSVGADETVKVGQDQVVRVVQNDVERVGTVRMTVAGGFQMPTFDVKQIFLDSIGPTPAKLRELVQQTPGALKEGLMRKVPQQVILDGKDPVEAIKGVIDERIESAKKALTPPASPEELLENIKGQLPTTPGQLLEKALVGSIQRSTSGDMTRVVGGLLASASRGPSSLKVEMGSVEAIGGAKMTLTRKGKIAQKVGRAHAVVVGGTLTRAAEGDVSTSSKKSDVAVYGGATLAADAKIALRGAEITLAADGSLTLGGGGGSISLSPGGVKVNGGLTLSAPAQVVLAGAPSDIDHGAGGGAGAGAGGGQAAYAYSTGDAELVKVATGAPAKVTDPIEKIPRNPKFKLPKNFHLDPPASLRLKEVNTPEFKAKLEDTLSRISNTRTGKEVLRRLERSGKPIHFHETRYHANQALSQTVDSSAGRVHFVMVSWNPYRVEGIVHTWDITMTKPISTPNSVALTHELVHAVHMAEGTLAPSGLDMSLDLPHDLEESMTIGVGAGKKSFPTENSFRKDLGLPLRGSHFEAPTPEAHRETGGKPARELYPDKTRDAIELYNKLVREMDF